jgi:hypothetical protein
MLLATAATLGVWLVNPYLALLLALGLHAWLAAAGGIAPGRLGATGLILLGLLPLAALVADLAGRFDAGLSVWHDLFLMLADGQIGSGLALLGCLLAGCGVALVALAGAAPARPGPDLDIEGEIAVRRRGLGDTPGPEEEEPEPAEAPENGTEALDQPEPAQPKPERDPRLWSKPVGSSARPPGSFNATPLPSVT